MPKTEGKVKEERSTIEVEENLMGNNDNENTKKTTKNVPFMFSTRFVLGLMCFFGSMNLYAIRSNLSISMPCMANTAEMVTPKTINTSPLCASLINQSHLYKSHVSFKHLLILLNVIF